MILNLESAKFGSDEFNELLGKFHLLGLTDEEIEYGLSHQLVAIRLAFLSHPGIRFTDTQIKRLLNDLSVHVRRSFIRRYANGLTATQFDYGLTSRRMDVRMAFIQRDDIDFTPGQVERGLKMATSEGERKAWREAIARLASKAALNKHASSGSRTSRRI